MGKFQNDTLGHYCSPRFDFFSNQRFTEYSCDSCHKRYLLGLWNSTIKYHLKSFKFNIVANRKIGKSQYLGNS